MPSTLIIYNPFAGRGRVQKEWPHIQASLRSAGVDFDAVATQAPFEAITLAQKAAQNYARVVAVGGDGTINEVVNGLLRASGENETLPVGLIPLGNGDDFAKEIPPKTPIGGKPFDWHTAVAKIVNGQTRLVDAGRMMGGQLRPEIGDGPHYFLSALAVGFGALAAAHLSTTPKYLKGFSAYLASILKTMIDYPVVHLRLQLDDQPPFEHSTTMAAVMNGRCMGNGFWVCPHALPDDRYFDLMMADQISRLRILRLVPMLMKGTHTHEPDIHQYRAQRVVIESTADLLVEVDGEFPFRHVSRLEIQVLPHKVRLMV